MTEATDEKPETDLRNQAAPGAQPAEGVTISEAPKGQEVDLSQIPAAGEPLSETQNDNPTDLVTQEGEPHHEPLIVGVDPAAVGADRTVTSEDPHNAPVPLNEQGLRTDGPTLKEFLNAGFDEEDYPPRGYAAVPEPGEQPEVGAYTVDDKGNRVA